MERGRDCSTGRHAGQGGGIRKSPDGWPVRDLRTHHRVGARKWLLLRLLSFGVHRGEARQLTGEGSDHRERWGTELGLRTAPALRDQRGKSDSAGSYDLAEKTVSWRVTPPRQCARSTVPCPASAPPRPWRTGPLAGGRLGGERSRYPR